ncbi:MAG: hypothetical protein WC700_07720 [Gemmatimonadaceae bacterium]|jgi:hypothetical protein
MSAKPQEVKNDAFVRVPCRIKIPRKIPKHVGENTLLVFEALGAGAELVEFDDEEEFTLLASGRGDFFEPTSVTHHCAFWTLSDEALELYRCLGVSMVRWFPRLNIGEKCAIDTTRLEMARVVMDKYAADGVDETFPKVTTEIALRLRPSYDDAVPDLVRKLLKYCSTADGGQVKYEKDPDVEDKWNLVI